MKKVLMFGVLFLCLVVNSCAKKQTVAPEDEFGEDQEQAEQVSDLEAALLEPEEFSQEPAIRGTEFDSKIVLETVYFSFDSSSVPQSVMKTLKDTPVGETVKVVRLYGEGPVKRRIMDMGITKGVEIYVRKLAPLGDPMELNVRGYELSVRNADAALIEVE